MKSFMVIYWIIFLPKIIKFILTRQNHAEFLVFFTSPTPIPNVVGCIYFNTAFYIFAQVTEEGGLSMGPNCIVVFPPPSPEDGNIQFPKRRVL
jgi:hypothetical protein